MKPCTLAGHRWEWCGCTVYRCRTCGGYARTCGGRPRPGAQPTEAARHLGEMLEGIPYRRRATAPARRRKA